MAAFAFTTSASAYPPEQSASLSASASVVTPGGSITVTGTHFKGLVTLTANGRSGPMVLGTVMANADGTFSTRVTLPAGEFPPGTYTITATDAFGDVQTITVTVVAAAVPANPSSGSSGLPNTGFAVGQHRRPRSAAAPRRRNHVAGGPASQGRRLTTWSTIQEGRDSSGPPEFRFGP